jgi:integrase
MPEKLSARLKEWLNTHNHDLVFPSEKSGIPLFPENIRKRLWMELLRLTECPSYHLHATRHFFASRLIEKGCTPKELSAALGHADEGFTLETYGHLFHDAETERRRRERVNDMVLSE